MLRIESCYIYVYIIYEVNISKATSKQFSRRTGMETSTIRRHVSFVFYVFESGIRKFKPVDCIGGASGDTLVERTFRSRVHWFFC